MHIGDLLGRRYRLDSFVDGGAMGEVWKGTDTRLNRTVAVKVLHASLSGAPAFRRRFAAEARAAAALRAPGVVDLYDYGEDTSDDGSTVSYLVMEFVAGKALSALLAERGRMPAGDVMAIIAQCATALDAAHKAGIIHRDVKPGNILIRDEGGIKVVDFGIARAHGESGLTSTGQVMGTVAYVSPEQLYDDTLTGASDIYSLGIVAYECLSGHKPFAAEAPAAVIRAQLHEAPPPLPVGVPDSVAAVVMRCLAKDAKDRWASGAELATVCRELASRLPQGDSTEPMDAADDEEMTVRFASPAVDGTRDLPAQDRGDTGRAVPVMHTEDGDRGKSLTKRKRLAGIIALAVLILLVGTAAVWQLWPTGDVADPERPSDETSSQSSSERDQTERSQNDGGWDDPTEFSDEPSTPDDTSDDDTSDEPSTPDDTSDDDTSDEPTEPSDEPTDEPTSDDGGGEDGDQGVDRLNLTP